MIAEIVRLDGVTPGRADEAIAIAVTGGEVISGGMPTDHAHQVPGSVIRGTHTGATVTFHGADVAEGAIAVIVALAGGRAVARLQPLIRHRLDPTRAVAAAVAHAVVDDRIIETGEGHRRDDETSARDRDHPERMDIDLNQTAVAEGVDTPQTVDRVLSLPKGVHLHQSEEDTLRHEADRSIVGSVIREVSRRQDQEALRSLAVGAAVHCPRAGGDARLGDEDLATTYDGTVPHLRHPPEPRASQLIFLKMNLAPRHRSHMPSL